METKFDAAKTSDEKYLDKILQILSNTIPEQTTDAMDDYVRTMILLYKIKDPRFRGLIEAAKDLYVYPTRDMHNSFMKELHEYKEMIHEERIKKVLNQKEQLGELPSKRRYARWILLALGILALLKLKS